MPPNRTIRLIGLIAIVPAIFLALSLLRPTLEARAQTPEPNPQELGAKLYAENCAVCHGEDGQGRVGATLAKDWPSIRPDLTVKSIIETGVPGSVMPAWSQANGGPFDPAEIEALVAYILSWQTGGAPEITPAPTVTLLPPLNPIPNIAGDPNRGAKLYAENCEMCHGEKGEGRIGATLAHVWPGIRPDLNIRNTIASGISGSLMPAWSRANGGPLVEEEIDDLVAFILVLQEEYPVTVVSPVPPVFVPPGDSPLAGWLGVALFIILLVVILGAALLLQRKRS